MNRSLQIQMGIIIRSLRETAGFSQSRLAHRIGVSPAKLKEFEDGQQRIPTEKLLQIAAALDAPVTRFFEREEGPSDRTFDYSKLSEQSEDITRLLSAYNSISCEATRENVLLLLESVADVKITDSDSTYH